MYIFFSKTKILGGKLCPSGVPKCWDRDTRAETTKITLMGVSNKDTKGKSCITFVPLRISGDFVVNSEKKLAANPDP